MLHHNQTDPEIARHRPEADLIVIVGPLKVFITIHTLLNNCV